MSSEDAFADLLLLRQCPLILGSSGSTFSAVAALFRRARLDVVGSLLLLSLLFIPILLFTIITHYYYYYSLLLLLFMLMT